MGTMSICVILYSAFLIGSVSSLDKATAKRTHNNAPIWIDHCWDPSGTHNLDPFCQLLMPVLTCNDPPSIENGIYKQPFNKTLGSQVTYECNDGYTLMGSATVQCEKGDQQLQWSKQPSCVKTAPQPGCSEPPQVQNGNYKLPYNTILGSEVSYECNTGYTMVGSRTILCAQGSDQQPQWSTPPSCVNTSPPECSTPPQIDNGNVTTPYNTIVGSEVSYVCNDGYTLIGAKTIICENGGDGQQPQWSKPPACVNTATSCPPPPQIENGKYISPYNVISGSEVSYECDDGYTLVGPRTILCEKGDDQQLHWSKGPSCVKKDCIGKQPADIVFIVDASGSIGPDYTKELNFVTDMVNRYTYDTTQFGMLVFSDNVQRQFYLNEFTNNKTALVDKIMSSPLPIGGTNTADALEAARTDMFTPDHGMRQNVSHIAIVVTDGKSSDPNATVIQAEMLRNAGVTIYSVGLGDADKTELINMSSNEKFVFFVDNFNSITSVAGPLAGITCEAQSGDVSGQADIGDVLPIV